MRCDIVGGEERLLFRMKITFPHTQHAVSQMLHIHTDTMSGVASHTHQTYRMADAHMQRPDTLHIGRTIFMMTQAGSLAQCVAQQQAFGQQLGTSPMGANRRHIVHRQPLLPAQRYELLFTLGQGPHMHLRAIVIRYVMRVRHDAMVVYFDLLLFVSEDAGT